MYMSFYSNIKPSVWCLPHSTRHNIHEPNDGAEHHLDADDETRTQLSFPMHHHHQLNRSASIGCCVFLRRPPRLGYRALPPDDGAFSDDEGRDAVRVVVGKERRVFHVDRFVLDRDPFRVLMETARSGSSGKAQALSSSSRRRQRQRQRQRWDDDIFFDVDAILFEHMLWLACDESSTSTSLFKLNLKEIIEFYSQDN